VALYVVAVRTTWGQSVDANSLGLWNEPFFAPVRELVPILAGIAAVVVTVVALARSRWRDTAFAAGAAGAAMLVSEPLRDVVFTRPYLGDFAYLANSYPSRHVVVTLALAALVTRLWPSPRGRRAAEWTSVAATVLVAVASVATSAHRASDVVGGVLLVGIFAPVYARGRVPRVRDAALRHPLVFWAVCVVLAASAVFAVQQDSDLSSVGLMLLIIVGTGASTVVTLRVADGVPAAEAG